MRGCAIVRAMIGRRDLMAVWSLIGCTVLRGHATRVIAGACRRCGEIPDRTPDLDAAERLLGAVRTQARARLWQRYRRVLPLGDTLGDRWEKARFLGFGRGASIYDSTLVFGDVSVGEDTWIGPFCLLDGSGGALSIGSYCSISTGVQIYTHDSVAWALTGGRAAYRQAPTRIGDRCHIGPNAVIAKGVTVGSGSIVLAGAVVTCDVPPGTAVAGLPARVVGRVVVEGDDYHIEPRHD